MSRWIADLIRPLYISPQTGGFYESSSFAGATGTTLFPGEVDGGYLLKEMGRRDFSRILQDGTIVPKGCRQNHAKMVLYDSVYCFTCGWIK